MLKLIGAVMLILSCGGAGICMTAELRRGLQAIEKTRLVLRKLQLEVNLHRRSMPEAMEITAREYPGCFQAGGNETELNDLPFTGIWDRCVQSLCLPERAEGAVRTLGRELSEGSQPETAFRVCLDDLRIREEELKTRLDEKGKVYIAAGFAAGCMLVITAI